MIVRVEFTYKGREKILDLAKSDEMYARLKDAIPDAPDEEQRFLSYAWPPETLIDLETDGRWLTEAGITFEIKKFKGTMPIKGIAPDGAIHNVYVQVPHVGLLAIDEVEVEEDCCTDRLQRRLIEGWRILCVCPPNAARRPDYILGRTQERK